MTQTQTIKQHSPSKDHRKSSASRRSKSQNNPSVDAKFLHTKFLEYTLMFSVFIVSFLVCLPEESKVKLLGSDSRLLWERDTQGKVGTAEIPIVASAEEALKKSDAEAADAQDSEDQADDVVVEKLSLYDCLSSEEKAVEFFGHNSTNVTNSTNSTNTTSPSNSDDPLQQYRSLQFDIADLYSSLISPLEKIHRDVRQPGNKTVLFQRRVLKATFEEIVMGGTAAAESEESETSSNMTEFTSPSKSGHKKIPLFKLRMQLQDIRKKLIALFSGDCRSRKQNATGSSDFSFAHQNEAFVTREAGNSGELSYSFGMDVNKDSDIKRAVSVVVSASASQRIAIRTEVGGEAPFELAFERPDARLPIVNVSVENVGEIGEM